MKEETFKTGLIALIGRPNVGKSTLMNRLIGMKVAITSQKPQTTRNKIVTVYTDETAQFIFLDTPGLIDARNALDNVLVDAAQTALLDADVLLWLLAPQAHIGAKDEEIAALLNKSTKPVIAVINKADTVEKGQLEEVTQLVAKVCPKAAIHCVSALRGIGVSALLETIRKALPVGPALYDADTLTQETEREITQEIIREKALRLLRDEVPHGIAVVVEQMREREGSKGLLVDISASILCERESHKGIIIGKKGAMLKRIGTQAREDIEQLLDTRVNLQLFVKVRKDWRNDPFMLKRLGYQKKK